MYILLSQAAATEQWVLVSCADIVNFGEQNGVRLAPHHRNTLDRLKANAKPPSSLQTMRAMLDILKERMNSRKPGPT